MKIQIQETLSRRGFVIEILDSVAAVCDRQVFVPPTSAKAVLLHPCREKTDGVRRTPLQKLWVGARLWGCNKSRVEGGGFGRSRAQCAARHAPDSRRCGSRESIEPKAVLEHRAPKTSPPILHTRGVGSKVGRAVHCAPGLVMQTRPSRVGIPGVRALTGAATLICSAVAAVCDRQVSSSHICGAVLLHACWRKTDSVRRTPPS